MLPAAGIHQLRPDSRESGPNPLAAGLGPWAHGPYCLKPPPPAASPCRRGCLSLAVTLHAGPASFERPQESPSRLLLFPCPAAHPDLFVCPPPLRPTPSGAWLAPKQVPIQGAREGSAIGPELVFSGWAPGCSGRETLLQALDTKASREGELARVARAAALQ